MRVPTADRHDADGLLGHAGGIGPPGGDGGIHRGGVDDPDPWPGSRWAAKGAGVGQSAGPVELAGWRVQVGGDIVRQAVFVACHQQGQPVDVILRLCHAAVWRGLLQGQFDGEGGALRRRAGQLQGAAHELHEMTRYHQPKPGAAEAARGRRVALGEGGKQARLGGLVHADAIVADPQRYLPGAARGRGGAHAHANAAGARRAAGEFDAITDKVDQDLAQPQTVAQHGLGHPGIDEQAQFHAFLVGQMVEHATCFFDHVDESERRVLDGQPSSLDLGKIEDVVDDREQGKS